MFNAFHDGLTGLGNHRSFQEELDRQLDLYRRHQVPVALLLLVLALAGPTWERLPEPLYQARQFRVVALDLSPSMNATDVAPSRLVRARFKVLDLLRQSEEGQTAMLAYGPEPYVVSPLTTDVKTIAAQVPSLDTSLLPVAGARRTDLALDQAAELLRQAGAPEGEVVLVTDGMENAPATNAAAARLRASGYRVSVLGVGTLDGSPVRSRDGGFLKDANGAIRVSRLQETALRALAVVGLVLGASAILICPSNKRPDYFVHSYGWFTGSKSDAAVALST